MRLSEREAKQHYETAQQQYAYVCGREMMPTNLEIEIAAKTIYQMDGNLPDWDELDLKGKQWYMLAAKTIFDAVHQIITRED